MKIRTRLILLVLIAAFLTLTSNAILQIKYQHDRDYQQFQEKILFYDRLVQDIFRLPLWNLDRASIEAGLEGLIQDPDIADIEISDSLGIIHIVHNKPGIGVLDKHAIAIFGGTTLVGRLNISYRSVILQRNMRDATLGFVLLGCILLSVLGVVVALGAFSITRPLDRMVDMVHLIGSNERINALDYPFKGELADLAGSIIHMADSLREHELIIQQVSAESAASAMKLRMEQELRHQSDVYRVELQNSLETLRQARQQLVTSERMAMLGSLVAGVSHEINTPIGVSVTAASYLNDKTREFGKLFRAGVTTTVQLEKFVGIVEESMSLVLSNLDRAAGLIRSFKQVSVDQASEQKRVFDFGAYIAETIQSLQPQLRTKTITVDISCPAGLSVTSFPGALSQILTNLVMNSLMHGFAEREAGTIRVVAAMDDALTVHLKYSDDGKGIPDKQLHQIFEPFFTTMRNTGGSGLGCYIVYNLVTQKLGGTIQVANLDGGGLAFLMEFPIEINPAGA